MNFYKTLPYKHQEEAISFSENKEYFAYFLEQGLGKTKLFIDTASKLYLEGKIEAVLFIAPVTTINQFIIEQLPLHSAIPYEVLLFKKGGSKKFERDFRFFLEQDYREEGKIKYLVTNIEGFSYDTYLHYFRLFLKNNESIVCIDEVHYIKNLDAQRTRNIIFGLSDIVRSGKKIVKVLPFAKYRCVLTGTPVSNSPYDLYSVFEFLYPGFWGMPFGAYRARYGLEKTDMIPSSHKMFKRRLSLKEMKYIREAYSKGVEISNIASMFLVSESDVSFLIHNPDIQVPYKNLPELKQKIAPFSFIRKKKDCLDLPDKIYEKVYVDMNPKQKIAYKEMLRNLETEYEGIEFTASNALTKLIRLAQITSGFIPGEKEAISIGDTNPKIDALLSIIEEYGELPAIVVGRFVQEIKDAAKAIQEAFPDLEVEYLVGEIEVKKRSEIIERFKNKEIDVLVATRRVIGTGLNLQVSSIMYSLSNDFSFVDRSQGEDRIHRPGQKHPCTYIDFIAKGTIDEKIYSVLAQKKDLLEYIRGKSFKEFMSEEILDD